MTKRNNSSRIPPDGNNRTFRPASPFSSFILHPSSFSFRSAFTLVEVLVGIIISTLIISASYTSYLAANASWEKSRVAHQHYQHARVALTLIEQYLRSALPPNDNANIVFEGENTFNMAQVDPSQEGSGLESDTLKFVSAGGPALTGLRARSDLCELEFYLSEPVGDEPSSLMMRKNALPVESFSFFGDEEEATDEELEMSQVAELAPNVMSFDLMYYDGFEWVEEWSLMSELPRAVHVTLLFHIPQKRENYAKFSKVVVLNIQGALEEPDGAGNNRSGRGNSGAPSNSSGGQGNVSGGQGNVGGGQGNFGGGQGSFNRF